MEFNVISPKTEKDLLKEVANLQDQSFRIGAGFTDLIPELRDDQTGELTVVNMDRMSGPGFREIRISGEPHGIRIGALVTAGELTESKTVKAYLPVLYRAALVVASSQIRQVATIGGNLCTASPAGDMACALMALDASCEILDTGGNTRRVPLETFFTGVRKTVLHKNEVLRSVWIPVPEAGEKMYSGFIKVGRRRSMECSVVALGYHFLLDSENRFLQGKAAAGSVAPVIKQVSSACEYLQGKTLDLLSTKETEQFAEKVMEYASPVSDVRAPAWYREEVLYNISRGLLEDTGDKFSDRQPLKKNQGVL